MVQQHLLDGSQDPEIQNIWVLLNIWYISVHIKWKEMELLIVTMYELKKFTLNNWKKSAHIKKSTLTVRERPFMFDRQNDTH